MQTIAGSICTPVIDHDDFVALSLEGLSEGGAETAPNILFLIMDRNNYGYGG